MAAKLCLQRFCNSFGNVALDAKDVSQFSIISFRPELGIGLRIDQLHIDPHLIRRFLDATLKNVRHAELLRDLGEVTRLALVPLRRRARNNSQIRDLSEARQNLLLNTVAKEGVLSVITQILEWQYGDSR